MKTSIIAALGTAIVLATAAAPAEAGFRHGHGGFHGHKKIVFKVGHGHYGHNYYGGGHYGGCFFKKIKYYDGYGGWDWKYVKTCY